MAASRYQIFKFFLCRGRTFIRMPVLLVMIRYTTEYVAKLIQARGLLLSLLLVVFGGCQEEESIIKLPPPDSAITAASPVTQLLLEVARLDGSSDNVLDGSSCLTVVLPVTVIVDETTIVVNTPADFESVEEALDDDDDGEVDFVFPIEVKLPDHTQVVVSNLSQLENLIDDCEDEDDFECIDVVYPVTVRVYDINNQVSNVLTITSDEALYQFIQQLEGSTYISIQFPLTLVTSENPTLVVNTYEELANAILASDDDCDDDDGVDLEFIQTLLSGGWVIDSFIDEGNDQTGDWENYVLEFNADGTLTASDGNTQVTGTWQTETDDGELELTLQLNVGNPFDDINEDWTVLNYSSSLIELEDVDDDEPEELKTLTLKKI